MKEKLANWVVRRRVLIVIVCTALLVPSVIGYIATYINYDILSYLPETLESKQGETLLDEDFNLAATAIITVKNMRQSDLLQMKSEIAEVDGVERVLWQDDILGVDFPAEFLPDSIKELYYRGDATMLLVTFKEGSSSLSTMNAVDKIEGILRHDCFIGGMSAISADTRSLSDSEMPIYILVAGIALLIVLSLGMKSYLVPFIFLLGIVYPIIYNLGTNFFLGSVSYITKSLTAVLQMGVTMDYSIFLLHRYDEECEKGLDRETAMTNAIQLTFTSVSSSALTTMAGFLAMCTMVLGLGMDIGLVMAKGVLLGVITTVTLLPAMLLFFDKPIHKYEHKVLIPSINRGAHGIVRNRWALILAFIVLVVPFFKAQSKTEVYYNLTDTLPSTLPGVEGTQELKDTFNMATTHFIFVHDTVSAGDMQKMMERIEDELDGIESVLGVEKITGSGIPDEFIPDTIKNIVQQGGWKMFAVNTSFASATDEIANQLTELNEIVKSYDPDALVTGEGAMTNDLVEITDIDFNNVNRTSIILVFILVLISFKSISVPALLVLLIEGAIAFNMGVPYFTGEEIPFIASIVIGTIQLGATVDYAILMTTRFREERTAGHTPVEAGQIALQTSSQSIIISAISFFSVTCGVAVVSQIDLISSLCKMLARGSLISMAVILLVLPPLLVVCDGLINITTLHWLDADAAKERRRQKLMARRSADEPQPTAQAAAQPAAVTAAEADAVPQQPQPSQTEPKSTATTGIDFSEPLPEL